MKINVRTSIFLGPSGLTSNKSRFYVTTHIEGGVGSIQEIHEDFLSPQ
jgi:hypothetical protein